MTMMTVLKYNGTPQFLYQGESGGDAQPSGSPPPSTSPPASDAGAGTAPTSPAADAASSAGDIFDFESIFEGSSEVLAPTQAAQAAGTAPPPELPTGTTPPPVQQAAPPVQQSAPPQQVQPPAQTASVQPPTDAAASADVQIDPYDPVQLGNALAANEAVLTEHLANSVFRLSPQETEALETNVVEAIPRLMARVLMQAQKSALAQMGRVIPVMIQRQGEHSRAADVNESAFYKAWPQINPATHRGIVWKYAALYRQMHPKATLQELIADIGPMVMMAAKVAPGAAPGSPTVSAPGRAPTASGNGRSPPSAPFIPAGGRGPANPGTGPELSPWEAVLGHES